MPKIIQGLPISNQEGNDKITSTDKITAGYFTGGGGSLIASNIFTNGYYILLLIRYG